MSLFLSRESDSTETGPQIFTKNDGAEPVDFIFASLGSLFDSSSSSSSSSSEGPGLLNSVLVENGGYSLLNGIFTYNSEFNNKPYYNKDGAPDWFIIWFNGQWQIYDFSINFEPIYFSSENVLYPWNVTIWQASEPIYNPVPTVTKVL
jgi:hypothetical protein